MTPRPEEGVKIVDIDAMVAPEPSLASHGEPSELRPQGKTGTGRAKPQRPKNNGSSAAGDRPQEREAAGEGGDAAALVLSEHDHIGRARAFIEAKRPCLRHWRDDFVDYNAGRYEVVSENTIRAEIYEHHDACSKTISRGKKQGTVPFQPNAKIVHETVSAAKAVRHILPTINQPIWLGGRAAVDPEHLVSFPNGILNLTTGAFLPPDPMLFTSNAAGFPYDRKALAPKNFSEFLKQVFDAEQDQIDALQELFGYCLAPSVSQEKAFMLLGPKRSGKDTIRNTLQSLLSDGAVCGPTLDSMGTNFGMSALIGKTLAIVGDMRLGSKADKDLLAENILKITGRGLFTIDRKHQSHWTGMLLCKLLLISNERPQIKDISGALASRFIIYRTRVSFYGREDPNLFQDKIKPELPGILNWALDGLRRMRARGRLAEPKSSTEERQTLAREGSPVLAFVEECLALDLEADIPKDELHMVYTVWSQKIGLFVKDKAVFMRELEAATGGKITTARPTINGVRVYVVKGARFKNPDDERRHGDADEF